MTMNFTADRVWESRFGYVQEWIDDFGVLIVKSAYGNESSDYGWEIDHIIPKSEGGTDELTNLRPLNMPDNHGRHHR